MITENSVSQLVTCRVCVPELGSVSDVILVRTDPGKNWISGLTHSAFIAFYMIMNFTKDIKVTVFFWAVFM